MVPSPLQWLLPEGMSDNDDLLVWDDQALSIGYVRTAIADLASELRQGTDDFDTVIVRQVSTVDGLIGLLAGIETHRCVLPLDDLPQSQFAELQRITCASAEIRDGHVVRRVEASDQDVPRLLLELRRRAHGGLLLRTSGTTGGPKIVVHDFERLLGAVARGTRRRVLSYFPLSHMGGINTLLHTLKSGSMLVLPPTRSVEAVCQVIARWNVEVLPTTPSFLRMVILSGACKRHDLHSLHLITYGAEFMDEQTLMLVHKSFPTVDLRQLYGMSELGVMRSRTKSSTSPWLKFDPAVTEARVVEGMLEVKSPSAMLGYLDAPAPLSANEWFQTGDCVLEENGWYRVAGRSEDIINVGGSKAFASEIEGILLGMPGVSDVVVSPESNAVLGQVVAARLWLEAPEDPQSFRIRLRQFASEHLEPYKVPRRVVIADEPPPSRTGIKRSRVDIDRA